MKAAVATEAVLIGSQLAVSIFRAWRRDLDCLDALILLVIARSNVDGILYDRRLRERFGRRAPIAPDSLRQPISADVVAMSLRLPTGLVGDLCRRLAAQGECEIGPQGMIIAERQLEAANRTEIVHAVYDLLCAAYLKLQRAGYFGLAPLPSSAPAPEPPVRSAAAHGAKFMLRLLSSFGRQYDDAEDALLAMWLTASRFDGVTLSVDQASSDLGLGSQETAARLERLIVGGKPVAASNGGWAMAQPWFAGVRTRNLDHLFQLYAGLGEVGAVSEFEKHGAAVDE